MVIPTRTAGLGTVTIVYPNRASTTVKTSLLSFKKLLRTVIVPVFALTLLLVPWILSFHLDEQQQQIQQQIHMHPSVKGKSRNGNQQEYLRKQQQTQQQPHNGGFSLLQSVRAEQKRKEQSNFTSIHPPKYDTDVQDTGSHTRLPQWMKDYFVWHQQQIQQLTIDNWQDVIQVKDGKKQQFRYEFMILRCYKEDERCGGLSDRLKPIPLLLLAAAQSKRIFYISWTRPCPLEEFLQPTTIMNWTMPSWLRTSIATTTTINARRMVTRAQSLLQTSQQIQYQSIYVHIHDIHGGSTQYNEDQGPESYEMVYHNLFHAIVQPSPPIEQRVKELLRMKSSSVSALGKNNNNNNDETLLVPGQYAVAHYRAEYGNEIRRHPILTTPAFLRRVALNAINCASELMPGGVPIYFASDSMIALDAVRNFSQTIHNSRPIVTFHRSESQPLHLDKMEVPVGEGGGSDFTLQTKLEQQREQKRQAQLREQERQQQQLLGVEMEEKDAVVTVTTNTSNSNMTNMTRPATPIDYYSTFIDFYLAGNGGCVSFGRGGFGRFANVVSHNWTCAKHHVKNFFPNLCQWHD